MHGTCQTITSDSGLGALLPETKTDQNLSQEESQLIKLVQTETGSPPTSAIRGYVS